LSGDVLAVGGAERERLDVVRRILRGELRQARAAELLGIGVRQVKRLVRGCRGEGEASLARAGEDGRRTTGRFGEGRGDRSGACGRAAPILARRRPASSFARSTASRCRKRRSARSGSGWGCGGPSDGGPRRFSRFANGALASANSSRLTGARTIGSMAGVHAASRRR
jgi:Helix-turn-helix domain